MLAIFVILAGVLVIVLSVTTFIIERRGGSISQVDDEREETVMPLLGVVMPEKKEDEDA